MKAKGVMMPHFVLASNRINRSKAMAHNDTQIVLIMSELTTTNGDAMRTIKPKRSALRPIKIALAALALVFIAAGCRNVKPIQRQYLSHRFMALNPDPARTEFETKVFESRESAAGGTGATAGGGCGCN